MPKQITAEIVRQLLDYDRATGQFTWRASRKGVQKGQLAGSKAKGRLEIDGEVYRLNPLANLHAFGEWPPTSRDPLTAERLRQVVTFDPETGAFTWNGVYRRIPAGTRACRKATNGYLAFSVDGQLFLAHRLAWLYMTGDWPANTIDHIDGNRSNNAWSNLRDVTFKENQQNRLRAHRQNELGLLGVSRSGDRFRARITIDGESTHIGCFGSHDEASQAYWSKKRELHSAG